MTLAFTTQEINVLVQLIDMAVKSQGIFVAEAAVVLTKKLQSALPTEDKTPTEETNNV